MLEQLKVHFDELLLASLFLIIVSVWIYKPDAKEWAGGLLAALIMALRNKYAPPANSTQTTNITTTTEETK
jgi:hypothetical protein